MKDKISIIILAYNDSSTIKKCIESVISQVSISEYQIEIIFVPNGCTDNTADIGKETLAESKVSNISHETRVLENGHRNKALNHGINHSTGDYIIYLNGDCHLAKNSISLIIEDLKNDYLLVGCKDICTPENIKSNSLLHSYVLAYGLTQKDLYNPLPNGRCIGFKRGLVKSFPENIHSEDNWIGLKVYKEYGINKISKVGEVYFQMPSNWTEIISLFTRYAQGTKQALEAFPELLPSFREITSTSFKQEEKKLGIKNATHTLIEAGFKENQIQDLFDLHKRLRLIVDDNVVLISQELVKKNGTWITDR